jgi:hypothetical protein
MSRSSTLKLWQKWQRTRWSCIDYEESKGIMEEEDNVDVILQQVELAELCDVDQIPANWVVKEDQRYVDKKDWTVDCTEERHRPN